MIDRDQALSHYRKHVNSGMARMLSLSSSPMEVSATGSHVTDQDDRAYLDCGGYCVFLLGHGQPRVLAAVTEQLHRRALATRSIIDPVLAEASAAIAGVAPLGLDFVLMATAGTEAVEAALKLAKLNDCRRFIAMEGAYHGKTAGALSVTGRERVRAPFEPLLPNVVRVPFGDGDALAAALSEGVGRAAVILESIQSEAGVLIPPDGYLARVRSQCDEAGAVLIADEISTGLGRTGRMWCCGREDVVPDILCMGKPLGGGIVPVSAMVSTAELFEPLNREPLLHGSTFGGNPLAARAALTTLDVIEELDAPGRARELGQEMLATVRSIAGEESGGLVTAVRGEGLLFGIEFSHEHLAAELLVEMFEREVILCHSMFAHSVVRLTPPITLTDGDCGHLYDALSESLAAIAARYPDLVEERSAVSA